MPTKKPKSYHLVWKETITHSAVVDTDWTPEEIEAHTITSEYSEEGTKPVWQDLLEDQVLNSREHVVSRELELLEVIPTDPVNTKAEDLTNDKKIDLIDHLRELTARKWDEGEFFEAVKKAFEDRGMSPLDPGDWGVLDRYGRWIVYQVTEAQARAFWEENGGTWRLCSAITPDPGGDHYVVMDVREENAPPGVS